ncbi:MAG: hypothetical protein JWN76_20 [Chitinophagaceae bacterium]|nr:hypothetical protein [Chitinophagaceae bacterium]
MKEKIIKLIKILCAAITEKRLITFYFESSIGKMWRTVGSYMLAIKKTKNKGEVIYFAGLPIEKLSEKLDDRQPGQYELEKLDLKKMEVLDETFDDPGVPRNIVVHTPSVKVICRFIYPDEDEQVVTSRWIDIQAYLQ